MLQESDLYALLDKQGIEYSIVRHKAVFTAEEALEADIPERGIFVKNLFLSDKKKREFYLVTVPLDARTDLKVLSGMLQSRRLQFVNADLLPKMLGVEAGSVTPLATLNDETRHVTQVFDEALAGKVIGAHPLVNTATIYVNTDDVCALIAQRGNPIVFLPLSSS
ncbi:MAG: prolyl-tRNA synthetase associated domain-containing protein [Eggerthellaceae bacterium]|nr:prolyl-tRNA synthetase associated domain-containing protein [Eggerthellaceae bacterium]